MADYGTLVARVFTSEARIPLENAAVLVLGSDAAGKPLPLAFRLTNCDGCTPSVRLAAPAAQSGAEQPDARPFAAVDLLAEKPGYDRIRVEGAQIFAGVETVQEFMLVPTPELPDAYGRTELVRVPGQDL